MMVDTCIFCLSKNMVTKLVEVEIIDGKTVPILADICEDCGEKYYDFMELLEEEKRLMGNKD